MDDPTGKRALSVSSNESQTPLAKKLDLREDREEFRQEISLENDNEYNSDGEQRNKTGEIDKESIHKADKAEKGNTNEDQREKRLFDAIESLKCYMQVQMNELRKEIKQATDSIPKVTEKHIKELRDDMMMEISRTTNRVEKIEASIEESNQKMSDMISTLERRVSAVEFKCARPIPREEFNCEDTIVATGIQYEPSEDIEAKAKEIIQTCLGHKEVEIVRAKRLPWRHGKPGIVKIQVGSLAEKIDVLRSKKQLKAESTPQKYRKVFFRSSKSHEQRLMEMNLQEVMKNLPIPSNTYRFTGSGRLVKKGTAEGGDRGDRETRDNRDDSPPTEAV